MANKIKICALINIAVVFIIDYFSKQIVLANMVYNKSYPIFKVLTMQLNFGFDLYLTYNRGTAFSLIKFATGNTKLLLILGSIIISLVLLGWLYKEDVKNKATIIAISCILGGALGNIYDRISFGYVVDFFDVYAGKYHWPIFNVADISISIGVCLLVWQLLFTRTD